MSAPMSHHEVRIEGLRKRLVEQNLDGFVVYNFEGSDRANLGYLTGFFGTTGILIVSSSQQVLMTDSRYLERARREHPDFEITEVDTNRIEQLGARLEEMGLNQVGIGSKRTSYANYQRISDAAGSVELVPIEDQVEGLRQVKDDEELDRIGAAVALTDRGFEYVLETVSPGMTERELAFKLEFFLREQGADRLAFPIIAAAGERGAYPHVVPSNRRIGEGDLLLLDFGARSGGYCADLTRVVAIGERSERQQQIYEIVLQANQAAIAEIRAGVRAEAVDQAARRIIKAAGYQENFGHGLGHGVGLEIHEAPRLGSQSDDLLEPGMVVTVEPGIYLPDWGGIRIEDLVVVTENGYEILTGAEKKELQVVPR
ncbi:MAG: M24 family metallopeptidase [Candidatus Bipolaricaulia bacterium]